MQTILSNSAPVVPALRYSIVRMVNEATSWCAQLNDRLMLAWDMADCEGRNAHMDAMISRWAALDAWLKAGVYVEADWDALCDAAFAAVGAFDAWVLGVEVGA